MEEDIEIDSVVDTVGYHSHQQGQRGSRCVNLTLQILFSTPGLVILVVAYSVMGALIFPMLEAPKEIHNAVTVMNSREECLKELWTITGERLSPLLIEQYFHYLKSICKFDGNVRTRVLL